MSTSGEIVKRAFDDWMSGSRHFSAIFSPVMTWEIVGHSAASAMYQSAQQFQRDVLTPFAQRFAPSNPFRPVRIRGFYVDGDVVIVIWDGEGTTIVDTLYENTYAWILTVRDGQVVEGIAFYDSLTFNELWKIDPVAR